MKKVFHNLCAIALIAGMLLPITACSSRNKTGDNPSQEKEVGSNSDDEERDERSEKKPAVVKKLSKNQSQIIKEDDPYFDSKVVEIKPRTPEGKEIESAVFQQTCVVGDRVLANIHYQLKKSAGVQEELDNMDMRDSAQWERYEQIWDEHSYNSLQLFDLDGNNLATIPMDAESSLNQAFPIGNDEILVVTHKMDWNDCSSIPKLFVISSSGKKLRDIDLDIHDPLYFLKTYSTDNGNLIVAGRDLFYLLDSQGKLIKKVEEKNLEGTLFYSDGKFYAAMNHGQSDFCSFKEVDTKEGKLVGDEIRVDRKDFVAMNDNVDCLIFENNAVEKYSIADGTRKTLLTSLGADVNCSNFIGGKVFSEDHMVFIKEDVDAEAARYDIYCANEKNSKVSIVTLDRASTNPHAGKEVLKLGICGASNCQYFDDIEAYNANPDSHAIIEVVDYPIRSLIGYGIVDSTDFIGETGQQLTQDMYSGNGPDIIIGFSDLAQLYNENMLLDMKKYLESDPGLNGEDYFVNLFHAFEKDGKLFSMPITYSLYGVAVNSFYEGAKEKWTYEDLQTMDSKLQINMKSLPPYRGDELLTYWLYASDAKFIDYENRTVNFDSQEFKALLDAVKGHSSKERNSDSGTLWDSEEAYINGEYAACNIILSELQDYCMLTDAKKGSKTLFTGYPSENGMNMCARGDLSMSISAAASNPDLAWEFIRSFLNEDIQQRLSFSMYSLPVSRKAFSANSQKEIELSEAQYKEYERNPSSYGSKPRLITQKDADDLAAVISSVERSVCVDSDILKIVLEEADAYIYGFSSIERVCGIIQLKAKDIIENR